jgi:exonuclease VII small subunit
MTEEVFRIVVTAGVALAAVIFLAQAAIMMALYRSVRGIERKTEPLLEQAQPVIESLGPAIERIRIVAEKAAPAIEKAGPAIERAAPMLEKAALAAEKAAATLERANATLAVAQQILSENRPKVSEIVSEAASITKTGRQQVEEFGVLLHDVGGRARARVEQLDESVDRTVEQIEQVSDTMKHAVLRPVREVNGLAAGFSAAVSTLVHGRKYSVDAATQDEEMFI